MKIAFALLALTCYTCLTEATLKHLKAKLKLSPFTQPAARYKYVASPVVFSHSVPVLYSSPVSTISSHTSTYSTVPNYAPSYAVYKSPTYSVPAVYSSAVAVPVSIYKKPLTIYEEPSVIHYEEPAAVSLEASTAFGEHFTEGHYSTYGEVWDK